MKFLELTNLHNPNGITGILHKNDGYVVIDSDDQGFQELPKSVELWQKMGDGRLLRVKRWLDKCIIARYKEK